MKTHTIDNKHYQECDVVMLKSNKPSKLTLDKDDNRLDLQNQDVFMEYQDLVENQHLYILSNEEIKEGDWTICYDGIEYSTYKVNNETKKYVRIIGKIIATTDSSLITQLNEKCSDLQLNKIKSKIIQIPQSFIEHYITEYNKGNVISKVLVELKEDAFCNSQSCTCNTEQVVECLYNGNKLKLNQNNEISILNGYKIYGLPEFLYEDKGEIKIGYHGNCVVTDIWNNWIKENLK
jgi:hypothetical protein